MGGCQSGRKVVSHDSKSDLPLASSSLFSSKGFILTQNNYLAKLLALHSGVSAGQ